MAICELCMKETSSDEGWIMCKECTSDTISVTIELKKEYINKLDKVWFETINEFNIKKESTPLLEARLSFVINNILRGLEINE